MPSITPQATQVAAPVPAGLTSLGRPLPVVYPRVNEDDAVIMGWDPGARDGDDEKGHVGVALACKYYYETENGWALASPGWRVYDVCEMTPEEFVPWFLQNAAGIDCIYGEMFRLDKKRAYTLIGSTMPTSQLIGFLRWYCKMYAYHIDVNWQSNMVLKDATAGLLREAGIRPLSPPGANQSRHSTGDHQRSAELHLWHGLINAGLVEGISPNMG